MAGDITAGIRSLLVSKAAITSLVSTRVYNGRLPQHATMPAIVYQLISGSHEHHLTGSSNFGQSRIQFDCYDDNNQSSSNAIGEAVRKELTKFRGAAGTETIDNILAQSPREREEKPQDGSDTWRTVHSRDYLVFHQEPAVNT